MATITYLVTEAMMYGIELIWYMCMFNMFFYYIKDRKWFYSLMALIAVPLFIVLEIRNTECRSIMYYGIIFFICFRSYRGRFDLKLGAVLISLGLEVALEEIGIVVLCGLLNRPYSDVVTNYWFSNVVIGCFKLIVASLGSVYLIKRRKSNKLIKRRINQLSGIQSLIFITLPLCSCITIGMFYAKLSMHLSQGEKSVMGSALVGSIIIFNILTIVMIHKGLSNKEYEYANKFMQEQLQTQFKYYKQLEVMNEETRSLRHDMKNHLLCIRSLLKKDKMQEGIKYIEDLADFMEGQGSKISIGDPIIDAILQEKYKVAQSKGIGMHIEGKLVAALQLEAMDKCTLIANVLDNAIEACEKLSVETTKRIDISIGYNKNYLVLNFSNPVENPVVVTKEGLVKTSKKDEHYHGFGLKNIQEIVNKYNGYLNVVCEQNIFAVELVFKS